MQQITEWLAGLGLGQYAQIFDENGIDFSVLPYLTDQDLEKLGVLLGHRRKLLHSIASLIGIESDAPSVQVAATPAAPRPLELDSAERRHVTVIFSDLVGSTALSARMDPEDLREVISAYQRCVADTVRRFDGFVAKYMGDGVLVYFGYPQAHEDDAERAVRAGLELIRAVTALGAPVSLQTRVGIATGLVVVGDLIGAGAAQEQAIVGETPNLAARLQGIAKPNTVVITESTRRLLGNLFELEPLGLQDLKGIAGPVAAWAALRPRSVESRFEAMRAASLTVLVGREEESELLARRWARAKTGEGQAVLLSGEAGIGKSRLTAALLEDLATEPHTRLRYFCSPQHIDSALHPIIGQMERAAGFAHDDKPQARLDKLDAVVGQISTQDAALFAEMLSLPNDGRYPALDLTPQRRRQKTLEALISQLAGLASQNPVLMIFEDAHWADPTSLELFGRVVDRIQTLRVLLIVTFRPEFDPPWIGQPHVTAVTINRLTRRDVVAMIDRVVGNKKLPTSIRQDIIERTDGIPLFVEEMTKAVLEAESEGAARRTVAVAPSPAAAVPASLHASLMARLDRLGPAKEVAQIASTIGREFSYELLAAVSGQQEHQLTAALDRLTEVGLVFRQGSVPYATFLFKHALVQDAAYSTLLRGRRQQLHARIGATLEERFPEIVSTQPALLAHHCSEAGMPEKAVVYWLKAGHLSLTRSALLEAAAQLRRGLALIESLPDSASRAHQELHLQIALGKAMIATKGYAARDAGDAFDRARSLCEQLGQPPEIVSVLHGQWAHMVLGGDLLLARKRAEEMLELGSSRNDVIWTVMGCRMCGVTCCFLGEFIAARDYLERGLLFYDPGLRSSYSELTVDDTYVILLSYSAWALLCLGYPDQAKIRREAALAEARLSGAFTMAHALAYAVHSEVLVGRPSRVRICASEMQSITETHGITHFWSFATASHGWCLTMLGQADKGMTELTRGLAAYRTTQSTNLHVSVLLTWLADACRKVHQLKHGLQQTMEAARVCKETRDKYYESEINRVRGELLLMLNDHDAAEASFREAIEIARCQSAKLFELRAATSLAYLWNKQGKRDRARDLLAPVYAWFTEGFDTPVLQHAKVLLDQSV
jgi:class 3 adenylate cyclase/tetratricopeptide (TPR) repeat protein